MTRRHPPPLGTDDKDERQRVAVLAKLKLLDTPPEREFDLLVDLARRMLGTKIALVSLLDAQRQWFKALYGLAVRETAREYSFCAHAILSNGPLIVPDAQADPRFATNPLVTGAPFIRLYIGIPIRAPIEAGKRIPIGTLCVIDDKPREPQQDEVDALCGLASLAEALLDARATALNASRLAADKQQYAHQLDLRQRQFRQAERIANIGSWRLTLSDYRTEWSDQVFAIHELPIGENPSFGNALNFYPPQSRESVTAAIARTIATGQPFDLETDLITAKGNRRRLRIMGELELQEGKTVALIGALQDVTSQHQLEQSLRKIANTDELTQMANRARFNHVLEEKIALAKARDEKLAVLLIDLDGFKTVNDRCGHLAGDDLLRLMASRFQSAPYLKACFTARLGGDEFVVIVSSQDDCAALDAIVDALLADLRHTVEHEDNLVEVSGSIGISWLDDTVRDRSELLQRADKALYSAKQKQKGSAQVFDETSCLARRVQTFADCLSCRLGPD